VQSQSIAARQAEIVAWQQQLSATAALNERLSAENATLAKEKQQLWEQLNVSDLHWRDADIKASDLAAREAGMARELQAATARVRSLI
jgi:hypothetical protein